MTSILQQIAAAKRSEVEQLKTDRPVEQLKDSLPEAPAGRFRRALSGSAAVNIIAEIKKGSPSKGILREDFDPVRLARLYGEGGAAALSVVADEKYFFGSAKHVELVRNESSLPVLYKDFIIDAYQLYYSRAMRADAVLLIAALLAPGPLSHFLGLARELGLDCLVEVHGEDELKIALEAGADLIGVNNRNLEDFTVNLATSERLGRLIPAHVTRVSESGITAPGDIGRLRAVGYNNFLVGEALVTAGDPVTLLGSLRSA
ncbi:MAG TPA: indole-3-glycerol phosphate synthase TrpC [Acidobacteriota bacterium]|nr:indole-3-glycerol phosphate synthase TrpC [Acidobacteriota bacterium]